MFDPRKEDDISYYCVSQNTTASLFYLPQHRFMEGLLTQHRSNKYFLCVLGFVESKHPVMGQVEGKEEVF